jgi:hypothetical protein
VFRQVAEYSITTHQRVGKNSFKPALLALLLAQFDHPPVTAPLVAPRNLAPAGEVIPDYLRLSPFGCWCSTARRRRHTGVRFVIRRCHQHDARSKITRTKGMAIQLLNNLLIQMIPNHHMKWEFGSTRRALENPKW